MGFSPYCAQSPSVLTTYFMPVVFGIEPEPLHVLAKHSTIDVPDITEQIFSRRKLGAVLTFRILSLAKSHLEQMAGYFKPN